LHSQVELHAAYGGVVPELASRDHIRRVLPLARQVMGQAGCTMADVDLIAYTRGPGLAGALLVGAGVAVALATALGKPALGRAPPGRAPAVALPGRPGTRIPVLGAAGSGGHTQLMQVQGVGQYTLLGETIDDAAGEAFDKSAKLLGLGYPGGPALARLAEQGNPLPLPCHDRCCTAGTWTFRLPD
jgi:N6-L-threonylcarbamoyladenine synthase